MKMLKAEQKKQPFRSWSTTVPDVDEHKDLSFNSDYPHGGNSAKDDKLDGNSTRASSVVVPNQPISNPRKFRRVVINVTHQNRWVKQQKKKLVDEEMMKKINGLDSNADILTFNPGAFKTSSNSQQLLTKAAKRLLCKPSWERTEEDLAFIYKTIDNLMIFKTYSPLVKQELAKSLHYESFGDGRIIIEQGHYGSSFFFVIKGAVAVEVATTDKSTGEVYKQIVNEIMAGGSFGEMNLMNGVKRAATVICIGQSEFLRIDKLDYQEVLSQSYQKEWEKKYEIMKKCPIFSGWISKELRAASATTKIEEYGRNKVIVKDLQNHIDSTHLIMSGTCLVVSKIKVLKERLPYGKEHIRMLTKHGDKIQPNRYQNKEDIYLVIRKLGFMEYFGLGERLENTSVISHDKVDILSVPTVHFLRHGRGHSLDELLEIEMKKYPTLPQAFRNFLSHRNWINYKKELRNTVQQNKSNKKSHLRDFYRPLK